VGQWFDKRKGLATGCVTLGAPLGGIFFSLVLKILFDRYPWRTAALVLVAMMAVFLALGCLLVEINLPPQQGARDEDDSDMDSEPRAHEISHMLGSPKFWLVSYALFGEPFWSFKPPGLVLFLVSGVVCLTQPLNRSVRAGALHPMGLHPFVCRRGQRWEQAVLLDDVVQHVSSSSFGQSSTLKHPAVAPFWGGPYPHGSPTGCSAHSTPSS
jgi:MFS family permease